MRKPAYQVRPGDTLVAAVWRQAPDVAPTEKYHVVSEVRFIGADRVVITTIEGVELAYRDVDPLEVLS